MGQLSTSLFHHHNPSAITSSLDEDRQYRDQRRQHPVVSSGPQKALRGFQTSSSGPFYSTTEPSDSQKASDDSDDDYYHQPGPLSASRHIRRARRRRHQDYGIGLPSTRGGGDGRSGRSGSGDQLDASAKLRESFEYQDVSDDQKTRLRWRYWRTQAWRPRNSPEQTLQLHTAICCLGVCCCCRGWKRQDHQQDREYQRDDDLSAGDGSGLEGGVSDADQRSRKVETVENGKDNLLDDQEDRCGRRARGTDRGISPDSSLVKRPTSANARLTCDVPKDVSRPDLHPSDPSTSLCDSEFGKIEAWLDEHPDFAHDYFTRKATRHMVDSWLVSHALPQHLAQALSSSSPQDGLSPTGGGGGLLQHGEGGGAAQGSKTPSGATTPVRKISAHEFERGGLVKPIVTTIDGTPTFLTPASADHHLTLLHKVRRKSRPELRGLDEREVIFMLVKDIFNELDIRSLCHKILQNVSILTRADRCSLFLVQGDKECDNRCLVSTLFDVSPDSTVQEMHEKEEIRVPWGTGIIGFVAQTGTMLNIPDAYQDSRFNHDVDAMTGYTTRSLLCMPIIDSSGEVIGVAQVINKKDGSCFTSTDEKVFESYLQFCGIGLKNAQLYERSQLEVKRNQVLLDLARIIFEEQSTIEQMVYRIMIHMQSLLQCIRVQILLTDDGPRSTFSRVFDLEVNDMEADDANTRTSPFESRFPPNIGITGLVASTGQTINIPDAYSDDRFDPQVDKDTSFRHRSILCMAIRNTSGKILGVVQLINKFDNLPFTKNDENFLEAFAIFCGMGLHNTHMYEKAVTAMAKQDVTLEVLSYHATARKEDAIKLKNTRIASASAFRLHDFKFDDFSLDDDGTLRACLRMFLDLDLIERFQIDYLTLCRWLLSVKKNYRSVPYHNWRHAFNVAQIMFVIITKTGWWKGLGEMECLALIIACLCHDLDHRGTNNSFQIKASSPLAQLYSTSTMEHHHFDQSLMILNSSGNKILCNCTSEEFSRIVTVLEEAILATDLAVYFKKRGSFFSLVSGDSNAFEWHNEDSRSQLRCMMMTACDVAAITKPWEVQKKIAVLVASEFFDQGDIEKEKLKITPIDMMNRDKQDELPAMQVSFIDAICLPLYKHLSLLSNTLQPLTEGCEDNRQRWEALVRARDTPDNNNTLTSQ